MGLAAFKIFDLDETRTDQTVSDQAICIVQQGFSADCDGGALACRQTHIELVIPNRFGLIKPGQERLKPVTKQQRFNQQRQRLANDLIGFLPNQLAKIIGRQSDVVMCV